MRCRLVLVGYAVLGLLLVASPALAQLGGDTQLPDIADPQQPSPPPITEREPLDVVTDPTFSVGLVVGATVVGLAGWMAFRGGAKFVTKENVLDNETRFQMYEYITGNPGLHLRAIADALDLSTTNVLWHLRKLEDADLVKSDRLEGYKVFYPVAGGQEGKRIAMASAVLRNKNAASLLEYIASNPGAHQREMARALSVNHGTVRWHMRKMLQTDLVLQIRREHAIQYYLTDLGAAVLASSTPEPLTAATPPGQATS